MGGAGIVSTGVNTYQNASTGNWNAVAFNAGTVVGGGLVTAGGGGRYLTEGIMQKPSPSPNTYNVGTLLTNEVRNAYNPSMGPPNLTYMATAPTPLSGGTTATGIAAGTVGPILSPKKQK